MSEIKQTAASGACSMPAILDLGTVEALYEHFREYLATGGGSVDCAKIDRVSTACLQVFISAIQTARNAGIPLEFVNISPALAAGFRDLGVEDLVIGRGRRV